MSVQSRIETFAKVGLGFALGVLATRVHLVARVDDLDRRALHLEGLTDEVYRQLAELDEIATEVEAADK